MGKDGEKHEASFEPPYLPAAAAGAPAATAATVARAATAATAIILFGAPCGQRVKNSLKERIKAVAQLLFHFHTHCFLFSSSSILRETHSVFETQHAPSVF